MQFENHFHGGRSSRLSVLREHDTAMFGAGKMFTERSEGAGPRPYRQIHLPVVQDPPEVGDTTRRASSNPSWRVTSAVTVKIAAGLGTCGELLICRVLLAVACWVFEQALEGCAAYASAMYGIPADEVRDRREPATGHEHPDRLVRLGAGETSTDAKSDVGMGCRDIEYLLRRGDRRE
jgi:hypothetical protein